MSSGGRGAKLVFLASCAALSVAVTGILILLFGQGSPLWAPMAGAYILGGMGTFLLLNGLAWRKYRMLTPKLAKTLGLSNDRRWVYASSVCLMAFITLHAALLPDLVPLNALLPVFIGVAIGTAWEDGRIVGRAEASVQATR